ncbi:MAG: carboxypeptidase regulatory-like domain-containing protein [Acidobacteriota bacterium]|nr:carboxypeptidase regulatory-like domain-containing protein [Blastocatellia bacterium]MDW8240805.1 carboxypeptidase regulatory-like domain-containing protein [Acidobacteriota bacterium]
MLSFQQSLYRGVLVTLLLLTSLPIVSAQQAPVRLRGQVVDELGAVVVGATVTLVAPDGTEKKTVTDIDGNYLFDHLVPGTYRLRAEATGFAPYENTAVMVSPGNREPLRIALTVAAVTEQIEVSTSGATISVDPESNAGAVVLRGRDLDSLPEDPEDLAAALQALAGPSAGPSGGQIYIDGFTGGRMPSRDSIREIRINQNPFSAEFERLGFGRIEILTRPGSDTVRGQASFTFNDESLNSRNPFAPVRAPHQARNISANIGGPIKKNKASFFFDFDRRDTDDNAVINAVVLDPNTLNPTPFSQAVLTPLRRTSFNPRVDYQLNANHTLVARYNIFRLTRENQGIGDFSLLTRAFNTSNTEHQLQVTETAILSARVVNETRFQYSRGRNRQDGDNTIPTINVLQSFIGGGAQIGRSYSNDDRWEIQNNTTWALGSHSLKFGGRLRGSHIRDFSQAGFGGTFIFSGVLADGTRPAISSIEQYRQKVLGNPDPRFNPNQFSITIGDPLAKVTQVDFGGFLTDDWRVRPNLTLSLGLRYEVQSNISSNLNFAPRLSFAWSPGGSSGQSKTVVRGGAGIFYDRFSENFTLQADRFDGLKQQQFIVRLDPNRPETLAILSQPQFTAAGVTNVPTAEQIRAVVPGTITIRQVDPGLSTPYTMQGAISVERQLPFKMVGAVTYVASRTVHLLRSRNINAPLGPGQPRPNPERGNIYQYEASGILNQHQMIVNIRTNLNPRFTLFANYLLGWARSDTDGAGTFPAYSYDLSTEYGRSALDVRHRLFMGGSFTLPWNVRLNPFMVASSGQPFNIVTGIDSNGDLQFTERPAFATDLSRPSVRITRFGAFDLAPQPGQQIIPRNYGTGPNFFNLNLQISKTFGFGNSKRSAASDSRTQQAGSMPIPPMGGIGGPRGGGGGGPRGGGGGGFGGGGFGGMFGGASLTEKPYNLTLSVNLRNVLNRNNPGIPIGNLSSPLFGQSNNSAGFFGFFGGGGGGGGFGGNSSTGNRRIEIGLRFSF